MFITDAQVHIWAAPTPERPWPADGDAHTQRSIPLEAPELIAEMDKAGVHRCVLVPPSWEGDYNDVALAAAAAYPDRFSVMGRINAGDASNAARLPTWKQQPGMLGIRLTLLPQYRHWLFDGTCDWFWPAAERAGVPVYMLPPDQIPTIDRIAERHPGLKIVIDHLSIATHKRDAEAIEHIRQVLPLARRPNVAVKASALPCYTTQGYPFPMFTDHLKAVFDAFGPRRMFWGSDLSRLPCPYRQCITHFTEELPFLKGGDLDLVMGRALCDWLGWPA